MRTVARLALLVVAVVGLTTGCHHKKGGGGYLAPTPMQGR